MKMKPKPIAYPPGWFTELIRLHNWPPNVVCSLDREACKQAPPPPDAGHAAKPAAGMDAMTPG